MKSNVNVRRLIEVHFASEILIIGEQTRVTEQLMARKNYFAASKMVSVHGRFGILSTLQVNEQ